jgi:hypothetical protein
LYEWVNYFSGTSYGPGDGMNSAAVANAVHSACARAAPSDITLLTRLAADLQMVINLSPGHGGGPTGGIQGVSQAQATNYRNQVLSTIARLSAGGRVVSTTAIRGPASVPVGHTASGGIVSYTYTGSGGSAPSGGGGGPSMPSIPGGGKGAEGTDPQTGLPSSVAPPSSGDPYNQYPSGGSGGAEGSGDPGATDIGDLDDGLPSSGDVD